MSDNQNDTERKPFYLVCPFNAGESQIFRSPDDVPDYWQCSCGAEHAGDWGDFQVVEVPW